MGKYNRQTEKLNPPETSANGTTRQRLKSVCLKWLSKKEGIENKRTRPIKKWDRFEKNQVKCIGMRNLLTDSKILVNRLDSRLDTAEETISKLAGFEDITQNAAQRKWKCKKEV